MSGGLPESFTENPSDPTRDPTVFSDPETSHGASLHWGAPFVVMDSLAASTAGKRALPVAFGAITIAFDALTVVDDAITVTFDAITKNIDATSFSNGASTCQSSP